MQQEVYAGIRSEATQVFTSVRQLAIGEYAAFAIVMAELLKASTLEAIIALQIVAAGIILFGTGFGRDWFIQAIRQNSYLLVAYELPQYWQAKRAGSTADLADLWILASRSESFVNAELMQDGRFAADANVHQAIRTHRPGSELRSFIQQQLALLAIATMGAIVMSARLLGSLSTGTTPLRIQNELPLIAAAILFTLYVANFLREEFVQSKDVAARLARNWLAYFSKRAHWDEVYLDQKGLSTEI